MPHTQTTAPPSLTGDVKGILLDWIRGGLYPPGSRLPSVPHLVEQLGVSRTVIREALQALVGMGFIDMRPGMGSFVRSIPAHMIVNADVMAVLIDTETMGHVVRARKVLESAIAALAVLEATEEDFAEIERIVEQLATAAALQQPVFALTPAFHVAVAHATHNPMLESVIASFNALMSKTGKLLEAKGGNEHRAHEYASHRDLLRVLRRRDPEAARTAMAMHIQQTMDALDNLQGNSLQVQDAITVP
jgi:GntR family transcriptional regulator, transcriptional repressor for pyruvate dehydrogenase complex